MILGYPTYIMGKGPSNQIKVRDQIYSDKNYVKEALDKGKGHSVLKYEIDTSEGQSGGGLLMYGDDGSLQ